MPRRSLPIVTGEYYHVFNRGVNKGRIFNNTRDYSKFLEALAYYQNADVAVRLSYSKPNKTPKTSIILEQVEIVSYCLMPNHFHLLLKQLTDGGINNIMRRAQNSYAKYFNTKYKRVGPLMQGRFRAVRVETVEQLIHVSRYIHLNPIVGFIEKDIENYQWSSCWELVNNGRKISNQRAVLEQFKSLAEYKLFVKDHKDYAIKLEGIKHLLQDPDV